MSRLGIGIHLGLEREDLFENLVNQSQVIGSDVALTNISTGTRKSAASDGAVRLANTVDSVSRGGIPMAFSMAGATNLVDTVLTNAGWLGTISPTVSDYVYTIDESSSQNLFYQPTVVASTEYTFVMRVKKGTMAVMNGRVYDNSNAAEISWSLNGAASSTGSKNFVSLTNTAEYTDIIYSFTTPVGCTSMNLYISNSCSAGTIFISDARLVALSAPAAGFADGTGAAEVYAVDLLSCAPTYAAAGSLAMIVDPYGWSTTGNPVAAQTRLFSATGMEVYLDASGFVRTTGGAVSTKKLAANTLSTVIVTWNGTNQTIKVDDETTVSAAAVAVPSGTTYWGNLLAGTSPFHGGAAGVTDVYVWSEDEKNVIRNGLTNLFSTVSLV